MSGRRKAPSCEPLASRRWTLAGIAAAAPAAALASPARARESGLLAVERALWEVEAELDVLLAGLDRLEEGVAESLALVSCPQDVAVTVGYSVCASEREVRQAAPAGVSPSPNVSGHSRSCASSRRSLRRSASGMAWPASTSGPSTWPPGQRPWRTSLRPCPPIRQRTWR